MEQDVSTRGSGGEVHRAEPSAAAGGALGGLAVRRQTITHTAD
ncbi:MAG: hypothetical protein ACI83Y_001567, partial [Candidatus Azotimanducaceae bacterium]